MEDRAERADIEIVNEFESIFLNLANKMIWELFWHVVGAEPELLEDVIAGIFAAGNDAIHHQMAMLYEDETLEKQASVHAYTVDAINRASRRFIGAYVTNLSTPEFKARIMERMKGNLNVKAPTPP